MIHVHAKEPAGWLKLQLARSRTTHAGKRQEDARRSVLASDAPACGMVHGRGGEALERMGEEMRSTDGAGRRLGGDEQRQSRAEPQRRTATAHAAAPCAPSDAHSRKIPCPSGRTLQHRTDPSLDAAATRPEPPRHSMATSAFPAASTTDSHRHSRAPSP